MSDRNEIERNMFGNFGIGPEAVEQCIRAEVTAWKSAETNPEALALRLKALRDVADSLGDQFWGLNPMFDHYRFMRDCGFED